MGRPCRDGAESYTSKGMKVTKRFLRWQCCALDVHITNGEQSADAIIVRRHGSRRRPSTKILQKPSTPWACSTASSTDTLDPSRTYSRLRGGSAWRRIRAWRRRSGSWLGEWFRRGIFLRRARAFRPPVHQTGRQAGTRRRHRPHEGAVQLSVLRRHRRPPEVLNVPCDDVLRLHVLEEAPAPRRRCQRSLRSRAAAQGDVPSHVRRPLRVEGVPTLCVHAILRLREGLWTCSRTCLLAKCHRRLFSMTSSSGTVYKADALLRGLEKYDDVKMDRQPMVTVTQREIRTTDITGRLTPPNTSNSMADFGNGRQKIFLEKIKNGKFWRRVWKRVATTHAAPPQSRFSTFDNRQIELPRLKSGSTKAHSLKTKSKKIHGAYFFL
jgi:hypothetical protein